MKKNNIVFIISWVLLALFTQSATAQSDIKARMKARQPALESLWKSGLIGENAKGYIEKKGSLDGTQSSTVTAENADRKVVYTSIAKSAGTTPEKVGKQRAAQIAKRAAKGLWLQSPKGSWYKK